MEVSIILKYMHILRFYFVGQTSKTYLGMNQFPSLCECLLTIGIAGHTEGEGRKNRRDRGMKPEGREWEDGEW